MSANVNIIVAIGGTGARVAESFVYMAATGLLNPQIKNYIFVVDKDVNCGDTMRLKTTISDYNTMREYTGLDIPQIEEKEWVIDDAMLEINPNAGADATFAQAAVNPGTQDVYLADLMHSEQEQAYKLNYGFYGHPSLGAGIYSLVANTDAFNNPARNRLFETVNTELRAGNLVHVFLLGSVFGGTGASLFPSIARSMQQRFGNDPNFMQGGALMLPYFTFSTETADGQVASVRPDEFLEKTATALYHYSKEADLIRRDNYGRAEPNHKSAVFDELYLLGFIPLESTCRIYAAGGSDQVHSFSLADLYGALAAVEFFNNQMTALAQGEAHLYSAHIPNENVIQWQDLPNAYLRQSAEHMVRFCESFLTVLYPMFLQPRSTLESYVFLQNLYGSTKKMFSQPRANLPEDYDFAKTGGQIGPFCLKYLWYWQQIQQRTDVSIRFFTPVLLQMITYISDHEGKLNVPEYFVNNYSILLRDVFKPDALLLQPQNGTVKDALDLQNRLSKAPLDPKGFNDLQPIYRAAYGLMK